MDVGQWFDALKRDGAALAAAAEGHLDRRVPSCPEWDVADLVWHTGEVHHFWGEIAGRRLQDPGQAREVLRPPNDELLDWYCDGVEQLAVTLERADPWTKVWSWAPQKDIAFIQRRMAQETAVHRWDAESAVGRPTPIDGELAVDGIDEFCDLWLVENKDDAPESDESVHLHSLDAPGEWVISVHDGAASVSRAHEKADAAVRAASSDLLLLLWRRVPPSAVEVLGDAAALDRFLARTSLE